MHLMFSLPLVDRWLRFGQNKKFIDQAGPFERSTDALPWG